MEFENGLPKPGRDLDRWICKHVFDGTIMTFYRYSTTHTFFQVMEAMEKRNADWEFLEDCFTTGQEPELYAALSCAIWYGPASVRLHFANYPSREAAYAHAVCCCAWKALGGEEIAGN